ncbi:prolyl oligopeptidase family protein [Nocardioides ochotonae]|uniref:hypothetical protein n=1 Tax=Nocardioides ochotonae TaxID=2685869 RepID=UPI00140AE967|nr:hypothetical protein [Nocardioides ochotonae]
MSLHDELDRIADGAPTVDVPHDTWARARRARRRDHALAGGAALAAVALVAGLANGLVGALPPRLDEPAAGSGSLGVPDRLHEVPARTFDLETDLAVGPGAAAWIHGGDMVATPVVVDAATGAYHLLDLPHYGGKNDLVAHGLAEPDVALSPDGTRLAYSYAVFGEDAATEPIPSGIRVVDLETGGIREVPLPGAEGTAVTSIVWSPSSTWIGWAGRRFGSWTEASMGQFTAVAGRIAPGATRSETRKVRGDRAHGVGDSGLVVIAGDRRLTRWGPDGDLTEARADGFWSGRGVLSGEELVVGSGDDLRVSVLPADGRPTELAATGDLPVVGGGRTEVVGTLGDRFVVRTAGLDDTPGQLLLLARDGSHEAVGTVDPGVGDLSLATALMSDDRPTVARPAPDWPWSDERKALVWGGTAALLLLALALFRPLHRRLNRDFLPSSRES